jgi:hypothetical protein
MAATRPAYQWRSELEAGRIAGPIFASGPKMEPGPPGMRLSLELGCHLIRQALDSLQRLKGGLQ